jgi:hypothetical protein
LFDSLGTSRFEMQLTSNNPKRRNEKLDLHGTGRLRAGTVAGTPGFHWAGLPQTTLSKRR